MADRWRCRGGAGHHTPVEHGGASACDSRDYGERNARDSKARRGQEGRKREHWRCGELRQGPAHSDERLSALGRLT